MMKFKRWMALEAVADAYSQALLNALVNTHQIDPYDASQLIKRKAAVIADERQQGAKPEDVAWSINRIWQHEAENQYLRDKRRDIEQNNQLANDIKAGKRPGPPLQGDINDIAADLDNIFQQAPKRLG